MSHGWKDYEKVYLTHRKDVYSSHFVRENPGPKYEGKNKIMQLERSQAKAKELFQLIKDKKCTRKKWPMRKEVCQVHVIR